MTAKPKTKTKKLVDVNKELAEALNEMTTIKKRISQLKKLAKNHAAATKKRHAAEAALKLHDAIVRGDKDAARELIAEITNSAKKSEKQQPQN